MPMTFTLITFAGQGLYAPVSVPCPEWLGRAITAFGNERALDGRHAS